MNQQEVLAILERVTAESKSMANAIAEYDAARTQVKVALVGAYEALATPVAALQTALEAHRAAIEKIMRICADQGLENIARDMQKRGSVQVH